MTTQTDFETHILPFTLAFEGGFSNHKNDKGGMTYRGISRVNNPTWQGWKILDSIGGLTQGDIINNKELKKAVADYYYQHYFVANKFDKITNVIKALCLFDFAVHGGYSVKVVQNILNDKLNGSLAIDGICGEKTIEAVNGASTSLFCLELLAYRRERLKEIIQSNPSQSVFSSGWFNRISRLVNIVQKSQA